MMAKKHDVHVTPKGDGQKGWKVTQNGAVQSTHRTQQAAIEAGKREATKDRTDLVTHGRNGRFRSKDSYGPDPNPPKDREH